MSVVTRGFSASTSYLGYNIRVEKCLELGNLPDLNCIQIRLLKPYTNARFHFVRKDFTVRIPVLYVIISPKVK